MEQKSILLVTTVTLLIALAAVLGIYYTSIPTGQPVPSYSQDPDTEEKNILTVSATGVATIFPDRAKIQMAIVTEGDTAEQASNRNAERFNTLLANLLEGGISRDQIETVQYTIYPIYDYSEKTQKLIGYRAQHSVLVTVISTESDGLGKITGRIIDVAIAAGVNRVDNIQFTTSEEEIKNLRSEALKDAVLDARKKADTLAEALGVTIVDVNQVSESSYIPIPRIYAPAVAEDIRAGTELTPGELKITASVHIIYEISQ